MKINWYDTENYIVLDLETTIKAPTPHFGASPTYPANKIVMLGWNENDYGVIIYKNKNDIDAFCKKVNQAGIMIVGHNIAFDLLYLCKHGFEFGHNNIWDTMKFHYIQTGRLESNPSLERVAKHWRLPFRKDTEIKERFKAGIGADEIDEALLSSYLKSDVDITSKVFHKQKQYMDLQGHDFKTYTMEMMNAVGVTSDITRLGLHFDTSAAKEMMTKDSQLLQSMENVVADRWEKELPEPILFNPNSSSKVESLLWGGEFNVATREKITDENGVPMRFKTGENKGKIKTKMSNKKVQVLGLVSEKTRNIFSNKKWEKKSGADVLQHIIKYEDESTKASQLAKDILSLRNLAKSHSTYFKPYVSFAIHDTIPPTYNHCVTQTGRLSSSKPNMQNISGKQASNGKIQKYLKAREGKVLAEFDYAQLEIRVLALASKDKQLIEDINNGVDMHTYFASKIFNKPESEISKGERKMAKGFSFQLQYGAGAKGIAKFWDVNQSLTQSFIHEYYERYSQVKLWQSNLEHETKDTLVHKGDLKDGKAVPQYFIPSIWRDRFGKPITSYCILGDISGYTGNFYPSPTKCKNYPIQSAASDIMFLMLNELHNVCEKYSMRILNTVHDSVLLEIPDDGQVGFICDKIKNTLTQAPTIIHRVFNVKSPVQFPVDFAVGSTLEAVKSV